jgi:hypothetical protein
MARPRIGFLSLVAAGVLAACSPSTSETVNTRGGLDLTCAWPALADTYDAGSGGCLPSPSFNICQVPNGTIVLQDGGFFVPDGGEPAVCTDACRQAEYALSCEATEDSSGNLQFNGPDPSLQCSAIPMPTPIGASFYCCPCQS